MLLLGPVTKRSSTQCDKACWSKTLRTSDERSRRVVIAFSVYHAVKLGHLNKIPKAVTENDYREVLNVTHTTAAAYAIKHPRHQVLNAPGGRGLKETRNGLGYPDFVSYQNVPNPSVGRATPGVLHRG